MGSDNDLALGTALHDFLKTSEIVDRCISEEIHHWILVTLFLGQPSLLNDVGSSHQFCTKLEISILGQRDLKLSALDRPLQVILDGGKDVWSIFVVSLL